MQQQALFPDEPDAELDAVEAELHRLDPAGTQVATILRDTLDQLYDGQHTGRWSYDQLHKTEKTHMGTLVEINLTAPSPLLMVKSLTTRSSAPTSIANTR